VWLHKSDQQGQHAYEDNH